jgi:hypothetical protein
VIDSTFSCCRAPGEGRGTATALLPASGSRICWKPVFGLRFRAPGLRIWKPGRLSPFLLRRVPSHLWLGTGPHPYLSVPLWEFRPIPVRRNFRAWDCKVTPADSSCQEGNTTGCIPSNDGLGAGFVPRFPHCGKQRTGVICEMCHFGTASHGRGWGCRGFAKSKRFSRPSRTNFLIWLATPALEALGYFQRSLRDRPACSGAFPTSPPFARYGYSPKSSHWARTNASGATCATSSPCPKKGGCDRTAGVCGERGQLRRA